MKKFTKQQNKDCAVMHWISILGVFFPLGGVLGTFFTWLLKRTDGEHYNIHGKEALNFQITISAFNLASLFMSGLMFMGFPGITIFAMLISFCSLINLVAVAYAIYMGFRAFKGEFEEYRFSYRFVK